MWHHMYVIGQQKPIMVGKYMILQFLPVEADVWEQLHAIKAPQWWHSIQLSIGILLLYLVSAYIHLTCQLSDLRTKLKFVQRINYQHFLQCNI